ncbi:hypothetical protein LMG29542_02359 [Paraburkholderia humisilvae]|uniref:Uncharacterized protein n=1 Tax=Paraburkholderia humisilvae TaxID=627669 RepID=A0A6J5DLT5_9BURK|nr:hypothetical protein LMG29542_02359 [Paraburkholderia humisilvae]
MQRYQIFVRRGVRTPKYCVPWHWLASLIVAFLCPEGNYCRLVDSTSDTVLLEWERLASAR